MTTKIGLASATSALALTAFMDAARADPIASVAFPVSMDPAAWQVDRQAPAGFAATSWQGRDDVLKLSIAPPGTPSSFTSWQGYLQRTATPPGDGYLSGDLWIQPDWTSGTSTDYIRTSLWGSSLPQADVAGGAYADSRAIFSIVAFTNENGVGRLQVWDPPASTDGSGWVDLPDTVGAISYGAWNNFEARVLPGSDSIEYYLNGTKVYTWSAPRGDEGDVSDQFFAIYLNARNNNVTSYDSYWSSLASGQLVNDGGVITAAPLGVRLLANQSGTAQVADGVTIGGTVFAEGGADSTLAFGAGSGVSTTADAAYGVASTAGGTVTLRGGAVTTAGTGAHGLYAANPGSGIVADGVTVSTTGTSAGGAFADAGGQVTLNGGSVTTAGGVAPGLTASGTGSHVASTANVTTGADWSYGAYAINGGSIDLGGGVVTTNARRAHGLLAEQGGSIASAAAVTTHGDFAHGAEAGTTNGAGTIVLNGGSVATTGAAAYGLLAYNGGTISGAADISTSGAGSFGVSADGDGTITLTGGSVTTSGAGSYGLQAVRDSRFANAGVLSANVNVTTTGDGGIGVLASEGGTATLTGGSVTTGGAGAYGLVASGTAYASSIAASNVTVRTNAADATGVAIFGSGSVGLTGGSVQSGGTALAASFTKADTASFAVSGAAVTSGNGILLAVDRSGDGGAGVVDARFSGGANLAGDVLDQGAKTTGYTDLTLDGATLAGRLDGVRGLTLSSGGVWRTAGTAAFGGVTLGAGGGTIDTDADPLTLSGGLAGTGDLVKAGSGGLTLTADSSAFAGTTTVDAGAILLTGALGGGVAINPGGSFQIVDGGAVSGPIRDDGALAFARSDDSTYGGALSGAGSLVKTGAGRLTLSGDGSAFTGTTSVNAGSVLLTGALGGGAAVSPSAALEVGDGGSVSGPIRDDGTLTFSRSDDSTYGGALSGSGSLAKTGAGRLTLAGDGSAFMGTTSVDAGSVLLTGALGGGVAVNPSAALEVGDGGALAGPVRDEGTLTFSGAADKAYAGALTGAGALVKTGEGRLTLSGDGSGFTGPTTIDAGAVVLTGSLASNVVINPAGTLQIGDGTAAGDLTGATRNDGTLIFARSDDYDYAGALSGGGALVKRGDGTLLLSGDYSYTGSTVVEGGLVRLASALPPETGLVVSGGAVDLSDTTQQVSSLSGEGGVVALGDTGQLTVNQEGDTVFAGSLTGAGSFTKSGGGSLNLTGDSTFTGQALVDGGRLAVNGALPAAVTVGGGGLLGGNGTIATVAVNGGALAPGNSIGTLRVTGDATLSADSTYQVEIAPNGASDRIEVGGKATIEGGTVAVTKAPGVYLPGTQFTILTAGGGVAGTFSSLVQDMPFVNLSLVYDPGAVYLDVERNPVPFADIARTRNTRAVAGAAEALGEGDAVYDAIVSQPDEDGARAAFDLLSGEVHAAALGLLQEQSQLLRSAVFAHALAPAAGEATDGGTPQGFWMQGVGSWADIDGDGDAASLSASTGGLLLGAHAAVGDRWRVGVAGGWTQTDFSVDARASKGETKSWHLAAYGGGRVGGFGVRVGAAYSWHDLSTRRSVNIADLAERLDADYHARTGQVFGEVGYAFEFPGTTLEPFAGLAYVDVSGRGFRESAGAAALTGGRDSESVTYSTLGARATVPFEAWGATPVFRAKLGWQHAFGDHTPTRWLNFASDASAPAFGVAGAPIASDAALIETGLMLNLGSRVSLDLSYAGQISAHVIDNRVRGAFSIRF